MKGKTAYNQQPPVCICIAHGICVQKTLTRQTSRHVMSLRLALYPANVQFSRHKVRASCASVTRQTFFHSISGIKLKTLVNAIG